MSCKLICVIYWCVIFFCVACSIDNHCENLCYKTPNGDVCGCPDGYRLAADETSCEDINECENNVCSQFCRNTIGSFECFCDDHHNIDIDGVSCKAIGKCIAN